MTTRQLSTDEIVAQALGTPTNFTPSSITITQNDAHRFVPSPSPFTAEPTTHEVVLVAVDGAVTCWLPGTFTPAHDGEYEVLHPVTGRIFRAEYDTVFEEWSCDYQYPTWRGCTEQVP